MVSVHYENDFLTTNQVFNLYSTKLNLRKSKLRKAGDLNITYQEIVIHQKSEFLIA